MNIEDVLYKKENSTNKEENILHEDINNTVSEKKLKKVAKKKVKKNYASQDFKISKYVIAMILDFVIFGIVVGLLLMLTNIPLIEFTGSTSRVLVLNRLTVIVMCNILLFMYFYFYAKDHKGSTPMMNLFKIAVVTKKKVPSITTTLIYNINFWIYLLVIDLGIMDTLNNVTINVFAIVILLLQILILLLLGGYSFVKVQIVVKEHDEK